MSDLIRVLPDSVANQIAAGEVIHRPASLVKELMENAVDSGADHIQVIIKDAGRTLVQVVDNGCGMSERDARLCFERHATSKITLAQDLFSIRTMGFRGEALASIAAVAQVELRTKTMESETGSKVVVHGSEIQSQEPVACQDGTSLTVRNLFYNIPARRKFLKSNSAELKHIITEFQRIALAQPQIAFQLHHNESGIYHLQPSGSRERIVHLFGKNMNQSLVRLETQTTMVTIQGYIGKPEFARKTFGEQFFFVNQRYMKHPYFHKAITQCYERLITADSFPAYFIFFEVDPARIDVNIHPTKTEIKFEDERALYQILQASVKESLGKFNLTPTLDFNQDGAIEIPVFNRNDPVRRPGVAINPDYNPFHDKDNQTRPSGFQHTHSTPPVFDWEMLYTPHDSLPEPTLPLENQEIRTFMQVKNRYILFPVKSGIMMVSQVRAYERILYEEFIGTESLRGMTGEATLFPVTIELNPLDYNTLEPHMEILREFGFGLEPFGGTSVIIRAIPTILEDKDPKVVIERLLDELKLETLDMHEQIKDQLARRVAKVSANILNRKLTEQEMSFIIDRLFACSEPQFTPAGKAVLTILQMDELEKRLL